MAKKTVPITLLTGYLGSGKTTLLNKILANKQGLKIAVIVNDIGEVNIDASLIQKGGIVSKKDDSLVALSNGCICCTLKTDLIDQITEITDTGKFDYIVIEASGICEPLPIAQTIAAMSDFARKFMMPEACRLDCIVTVVDALRMAKEFGCGDNLTKDTIEEEDIENLVIQQIEFCNVIILNKIDEISKEELNRVRAVIKKLQPFAQIIETNYAEIDFNEIIDCKKFNFEKASVSAGWIAELEKSYEEEDDNDDDDHDHHDHEKEHHDHDHGEEHEHGHHHHHHHDGGEVEEYGIGTYVYYRREPMELSKFDEYVTKYYGKNIIRSKGVVYFKEDPDMSYMFDQAGTQRKLVKAGLWIHTAPKEEQEQMLAESEELRRDWDETYGDRMVKIVIIGKDLNRAKIKAEFDRI